MMSEKQEQNMLCIYRCRCRFIIHSPNGNMAEIYAFLPVCCLFRPITSVVDMKLTSSDKPKYQTLTGRHLSIGLYKRSYQPHTPHPLAAR